jgi:hypothetical protein
MRGLARYKIGYSVLLGGIKTQFYFQTKVFRCQDKSRKVLVSKELLIFRLLSILY